jgi:hypothetical protein
MPLLFGKHADNVGRRRHLIYDSQVEFREVTRSYDERLTTLTGGGPIASHVLCALHMTGDDPDKGQPSEEDTGVKQRLTS